jgi:hypothetical protein
LRRLANWLIHEEFGQDISEIAEIAQYIDNKDAACRGAGPLMVSAPLSMRSMKSASADKTGLSVFARLEADGRHQNYCGAQACRQELAALRPRVDGVAVANARVEPKGNAIIITKQASAPPNRSAHCRIQCHCTDVKRTPGRRGRAFL